MQGLGGAAMRRRIVVWVATGLVAVALGGGSALAFNPQPDPPAQAGIKEKVHLPIYDALRVSAVY
jgi:hypothetical protein